MAKGQPLLAHHLFNTTPMYLLDYPVLFHKKVVVCHWEHSKHFYILWHPQHWYHLTTLDTANVRSLFVTTCDDKISNYGF